MKKQFTTAFMMAAAITAANAQLLKFDGSDATYGKEAGAKVDTVNWYFDGDQERFPFTFEAAVDDDEASNGKALRVVTENTCNDWERCLKFDGLQIKPASIYRVRLTCKAPYDAPVQVALMCGDEYKDMTFMAPDGDGYQSFRTDLTGWSESEYQTKTAMFYYTSDEFQQKIYPSIKADDPDPLGANRFLRLTLKGEGEYMIDGVVVEEAPIAGIYFCGENNVIKVDFGFTTNAALLAKNAGGTLVLDNSLFSVTIDGQAVPAESVEVKEDGGLYIFVSEDLSLDESSNVSVSFNNPGLDLTYTGVLTPGEGVAVPSFTAEAGQYDESLWDVVSIMYEEPKLVTADPVDGSFELDGSINEFKFTYNKKVFVSGENAPTAHLTGQGLDYDLIAKTQDSELGTTVIFTRPAGYGATLPNGAYTITVENVMSEKMVTAETTTDRVDFEVGKVKIAEEEITPLETVYLPEETGANAIPEGWTCYKEYTPEGEAEPMVEEWAGGSSCRSFKFSADGVSQTGFYICDRDDARWTLVYGAVDGHLVHLPAGNIDFGVQAVGWQGQHPTIEWELKDFYTNEVVAISSGALDKSVAAAGDVISEYTRISERFKLDAEGDYILTIHNRNDISAGAIILGYDAKSYTKGEGQSAESEVIVSADFSDVNNGAVPAEGAGWTVYDNGNPGIKGEAQSGRNRMMDLGSCTNMTRGFYNRCFGEPAAYNMTYGEEEQGEPALELEACKYSFTWDACNWKGDANGNTYYFEIKDEYGDVVYSRQDQVYANVNGGAQEATAEKISFNWTPSEAGKYILNWYMTGESVVGNIKIEKMGSLAVYYRNLLANAVQAAKEMRIQVNDDLYAGKTRDALDAVIVEASNPDFHTGAEYNAEIERVNSFVEAMKARRAAMAEYNNVLASSFGLIEELTGTKYEGLDAFQQLKNLYEQYNAVAPSTLEDEELLPIQQQLTTSYNFVLNMKNSVVALYTTQINRLLGLLAEYDVEGTFTEHDVVIAAENALSDDQELATRLQKMVTAAIYERIGKGENPFVKTIYDEILEEEVETPVTIDLTGYIQNADVYCTTDKNHKENMDAATAMDKFPGWTIVGTTNVAWGWDSWTVDEYKPADNGRFATPWGGSVNVSQVVANLPVGNLVYKVDTGDGSHIGEYDAETNTFSDGFENKSTIYYQMAGDEEATSTPFNLGNSNPWRGMATCETAEFALPEGEYSLGKDLTVGAAMVADGDFANVDNFRLYMTSKDPNFDYAAAAAAIKKELETSVKGVKDENRTDAPVSTTYFTAAGVQTTAPKGVVIKVERWADGFTRVTKTVK